MKIVCCGLPYFPHFYELAYKYHSCVFCLSRSSGTLAHWLHVSEA